MNGQARSAEVVLVKKYVGRPAGNVGNSLDETRAAVGTVDEGVNELAGERAVPSSAEEGWREAPGWCWSRNMMEFDQHHPVCAFLVASQLLFLSRIHPSSAEEGTLLSPANSFTPS